MSQRILWFLTILIMLFSAGRSPASNEEYNNDIDFLLSVVQKLDNMDVPTVPVSNATGSYYFYDFSAHKIFLESEKNKIKEVTKNFGNFNNNVIADDLNFILYVFFASIGIYQDEYVEEAMYILDKMYYGNNGLTLESKTIEKIKHASIYQFYFDSQRWGAHIREPGERLIESGDLYRIMELQGVELLIYKGRYDEASRRINSFKADYPKIVDYINEKISTVKQMSQ